MAEMTAELPASLGGEGASRLSGFEVTVFTAIPGSSPAQFDPEAAQTRLRTIECGPLMRDAAIGVSSRETALTVKAAVRAIYANGVRSPWRVTNSDVVDANTSPFPTKDDLRQPLDLNGRKVFTDPTPPTSGMVTDDLWFDTTPIEAGRLRYTPYIYDGAGWVPYDGPPIVVSALAAFGSVVASSLSTEALTAIRAYVQTLIAEDIEAGSIVAGAVAAGLFQTAVYTEDENENPTVGGKMFNGAGQDVLKIAPGSLHIGAHPGNTYGFVVAAASIHLNGSGGVSLNTGGDGTGWGVSSVALNNTASDGVKSIAVTLDASYPTRVGHRATAHATVELGSGTNPTHRMVAVLSGGAIRLWDTSTNAWGDPYTTTGDITYTVLAQL